MAKKDKKKEQEKVGKSLKAKFNDAFGEMKEKRMKEKGEKAAARSKAKEGGCGKGCDCGK